ncbi:MAG: cysteine hydrolase family protein [Chthoniobacterales bacterium]|nr:cysteine hydrolase family protein [Chthoniobacterales bacterium]MCX7713714.1 cysteine hydrolase family protein [Chthoniobacterales bacterium]
MSKNWKFAYRSFYYQDLEDIPNIVLLEKETALLVIDLQNVYLRDDPNLPRSQREQKEYEKWLPFFRRMRTIVLPAVQKLLAEFRNRKLRIIFARIACLTPDGSDRSLSQRRPGFNNLLLPAWEEPSQILPEVAPLPQEIVLCKTTDSALTGTNLRLLLHNLGIRNVVVCGIFTDQCVSSTVRSLADESFNVVVAEEGCAAGTDELHHKELEIINNIYCQVMSVEDILEALHPN